MNRTLLIPLSGLVALCCTCGQLSLTGGSSQQGNGMIVGYVAMANGSRAIGALVRIRPIDYVKPAGNAVNNSVTIDAITDSTGRFSVSGIFPGRYAVEANDRASFAALVTTAVTEQNSRADVGTVGLKPYARIFGAVDNAAGKAQPQHYVQVQGLERLARVGLDGTFAIVDLPEGSFNLRLVTADSTPTLAELSGINALSDVTESVVICPDWRYSRRLCLNTTASGADVAGSVTNFPVLIRLAADNFDFSQAASDGADIRFAKSDNTTLPHEIERWDAINTVAEIWVRVDTVRGGDSTQFLTVLWGNETAAYRSNGEAVFDTATGFAGVWHLNDIGSTIHDATGHAFNGMNSGSTITAGIIGHSRNVANGNYIRIPGLLETPFNVTLSAWVLSDTSLARGQDIVSIGDAVLIRFDDILGMGTAGCYHNTALVSDTSYVKVNSGQYLAKTGWHYLTFSINTATHAQTLYIDGVQSVNSHDASPINYARLGTDTYFGIHGNGKTGFNFIGRIDEVRVNSTAVSPDWIKLCFMNQKAADKLVKW